MSEYCYQCLKCGEFFEECKCPDGFADPMKSARDFQRSELQEELAREGEFDAK
jgi:hypothetical protein